MNEQVRYHQEWIDPEGQNSQARIFRLTPPGSRVLDLGCSTGGLGAALLEKGCAVTGLEFDPSALASATGRLGKVVPADLDRQSLLEVLPGESFDVIIAADVLEHLKDPESVVAACRDMLAPEGALLFSIPNVAHAAVRLALWGGEFPYESTGLLDQTHIRFFTLTSLESFFRDASFDVTHLERVEAGLDMGPPHRTDVVPPEVLEAMLEEAEALTFQFVGRAVPTGARAPLPQGIGQPVASPQEQVIAEQGRLIAGLRAEVSSLQHRVEFVEGTRVWQARERIQPLRERLRRRR